MRINRGFTLLESLLYVSAAGVVLLITTTLVISLVQSRVKQQTIAEVEQTGRSVLARITQTIRNADAITSPAAGGSASSVTLQTYASQTNPTIFDLSSGTLRITEGVGAPIPLTSSKITASNLIVTNLSAPSTPGTVKISFTLAGVNVSGRYEYDYTKTFTASASLR